MKNTINYILTVIICTVIAFSLFGCSSSSVDVSEKGSGKAVFKTSTANIEKDLEAEDIKKISEIFNGKKTYSEEAMIPSCSFSPNVSVIIDNQTFCFAMDGCFFVKVGDSYFDLTIEEYSQLKVVLNKYGFSFPCV